MDEKKFKKAYEDLVEVFPPETDNPRFRYTRRTWVFPQHIDLVIRYAKELAGKYNANEEICALGALLHDAGLAYKRDKADPSGHENRSVEYVQTFLPKYDYDDDLIKAVEHCVEVTKPDVKPKTMEAKIVRTADGLSHILSVHYLAKAIFTEDLESGIAFVAKKVEKDWKKLALEEEKELVAPIYNYFKDITDQYYGKKRISIV